jgi:predicted DsbA family dithiol-disulfide isomerase
VDGKVADKEVAQNMAEARSLGLDATPTLYINGRKFVGALEWPVLQQLITLEIEHAASAPKTTAKAEEAKCEETCVVNIPKIASK